MPKLLNEMTLPLESGQFYHIYNRGINRKDIFFKVENYHYFLKKFDKYLSGYVDTYAYCLLPNHFHLLIKIKESNNREIGKIVSNQFRLFFMSYSKSINVQENREGSLFKKIFRRKRIDNDNYLMLLICYINTNFKHHNVNENINGFLRSSYSSILAKASTKLKRVEVLNLFGGVDDFILAHKTKMDHLKYKDYWLE